VRTKTLPKVFVFLRLHNVVELESENEADGHLKNVSLGNEELELSPSASDSAASSFGLFEDVLAIAVARAVLALANGLARVVKVLHIDELFVLVRHFLGREKRH